ncbi:MAG TPA: alpha-glucosidase, partial [Verrucomicrobiae bacterium]|nr:alpha-glucosidase [Verrucomicrobiae bacterium]
MKRYFCLFFLGATFAALPGNLAAADSGSTGADLNLVSKYLANGGNQLALDGFFYETAKGRTAIPVHLDEISGSKKTEIKMPDGRVVRISVKKEGHDFLLQLTANPSEGITKWGLAIRSQASEYFTGIMERTVDGPQQYSWAPGVDGVLNLRGQTVDMILKPTMSVYAPYYISSRGYAAFVQGDWPGFFDFCKSDPDRVKIEFEGPSFAMKIYTARTPAELVKAHALDAGPPFLPPKWMYRPWRWRDENKERSHYYDGTPVTGPFNSEAMEDILLMKAYGIP